MTTTATALSLEGVGHAYAGDTVLHDVSLTIAAGDVLAVVGPSGSGKTTLLAIAGGLMRPDRGAVRLGTTDLTATSERQRAKLRAREIGFIFQAANLAPFLTAETLLDLNGRLAGRTMHDRRTDLAGLLSAVRLNDRSRALPGELSGGERQRLAVAAALAKAPRILLADEPTAALDSERGREVMELIRDLAKQRGAAVVLSTHDERMLDLADRIVRLRDGVVSEQR